MIKSFIFIDRNFCFIFPKLKLKVKLSGYLYLVISLVELYGEFTHSEVLTSIAKPMLMPLLVWYLVSFVHYPIALRNKLMVAAFAFSWIGDIALMRAAGRERFFLIGLVAFLITHLLYIVSFTMVADPSQEPILRRRVWVALPLAVYLSLLLAIVFPAVVPELKVPVAVYTGVLATMALFALNRYKRVNDRSFALVFGGALLFMISDSLIGINLFVCHGTLFMGGIAIVATYMAGQYLIAKGMVQNDKIKLT